ncbi:hypothetical protein [Fulvivirga sp.]|uniref:hypothetical protein n=1 Tax=Fulvivirga sp. TaxID=1931237 RepID=UPI0032EBDA62
MRCTLILLFTILSLSGQGQSKLEYLKNNRFDLNKKNFTFPQEDFKILGFGAYHGSQKTEITEHLLLKALTKNGTIKYYLPETDFSIAHYFNQYLQSGDTVLLKDLVIHYGSRIPQERSIETYNKWKALKKLNDNLLEAHKLTVAGIDLLVSYKYSAKHLLELLDSQKHSRKSVSKVAKMIANDTVDFMPFSAVYTKEVLKQFVEDYESNIDEFDKSISNKFAFNHIIKNLKETFIDFDNSTKRERLLFENYVSLANEYQFDKNRPFVRLGFFHLEKQREGKNPSFFVQLIESGTHKHEEVISVIGYFTESRVLWGITYDDDGNYKEYSTEGGYGIGDYEDEYFLGIDKLKESRISDITLFRLNQVNTPYSDGVPDLMEIVMTNDESNGELVKGRSTTEYLDYAVLISNSAASVPIEEIDKEKIPLTVNK